MDYHKQQKKWKRRRERIFNAWCMGKKTYAQIAKAEGISRQRVAQLVKQYESSLTKENEK